VVKSRKRTRVILTPEKVEELLGVPRFKDRKILHEDEVGVTVGLAWTEKGGDILLIEANLMPGKGNLILTGQMGDVMQESARAALSFLRSQAHRFGLKEDFYREKDIHIHIPEGAIPKDGPSAGISMASSLASVLTGIPVRHDIAMTGEVTLRGKVLPIGGLKEKILAAKQHEVYHVLLPRENEKDLTEVPEALRKGMTFHFVDTLLDVLKLALRENPVRKVATLPADHAEPVRPETSR
jgi:ATP-dependent Lon protease